MKKNRVVTSVTGLALLVFAVNIFAAEPVWEEIGRGNFQVRAIALMPQDNRIIYIGSKGGVFKSEDSGSNWRNILSTGGENNCVNYLLFCRGEKDILYAATANGLFSSDNQAKSWRRLFKGKNYLENECTALAVLPGGIYLGTAGGLFKSKDQGRSWQKVPGKVSAGKVLALAWHPQDQESVYAACSNGLFKAGSINAPWMSIFSGYGAAGEAVAEERPQEDVPEAVSSGVACVAIDPLDPRLLYLATANGIYKSMDKGGTWQRMPGHGLLNRDVRFLLVYGKSRIYAAAKSGIFAFRDDRWQELSFGLAAGEVRSLAMDDRENLYAACAHGLFRMARGQSDAVTPEDPISAYSLNEPSVNAVQEAAVNYAEVHPEKIARWRREAAWKSWLPQLSTSLNRDTGDLWHWESGSTTKAGDDVLTRGRDTVDWDITLSWDLSELIWNNDQTSIDARSRLMVELRNDILDEVTKLYFERLRVKMELDNLSLEDRKKKLEKELRLKELTASLDALSGGYFSRQIKPPQAEGRA